MRKVGDKVKIRSDLNGGIYGVVLSMLKFRGTETTIYRVLGLYYDVKSNPYAWAEEMFEPSLNEMFRLD